MEQRTIALPAIDCAVLEAGRGGRPLLLVHGYTGAKEDFAEHADALADLGWWVVAPDLRGHGDSSKPDTHDDYSLELFSADLDDLVGALGWQRYVILGHSMGGMIVQVHALANADRIDGLILMDTGHGPLSIVDRDTAALGIEIAASGGMAAVKEVLDAMAGDAPLGNAAFDRMCAERPGYKEWSDQKLLTSSPAMYGSMLLQFLDLDDRLDALADLDMPTLVLYGELDADFVVPSARLAEAIPNATLVELPDGGHSPQFEAPEAWRAAVVDFLSSLPD